MAADVRLYVCRDLKSRFCRHTPCVSGAQESSSGRMTIVSSTFHSMTLRSARHNAAADHAEFCST